MPEPSAAGRGRSGCERCGRPHNSPRGPWCAGRHDGFADAKYTMVLPPPIRSPRRLRHHEAHDDLQPAHSALHDGFAGSKGTTIFNAASPLTTMAPQARRARRSSTPLIRSPRWLRWHEGHDDRQRCQSRSPRWLRRHEGHDDRQRRHSDHHEGCAGTTGTTIFNAANPITTMASQARRPRRSSTPPIRSPRWLRRHEGHDDL